MYVDTAENRELARQVPCRLCVTVTREMVRDTKCECKYEKVSRHTVRGRVRKNSQGLITLVL